MKAVSSILYRTVDDEILRVHSVDPNCIPRILATAHTSQDASFAEELKGAENIFNNLWKGDIIGDAMYLKEYVYANECYKAWKT